MHQMLNSLKEIFKMSGFPCQFEGYKGDFNAGKKLSRKMLLTSGKKGQPKTERKGQ